MLRDPFERILIVVIALTLILVGLFCTGCENLSLHTTQPIKGGGTVTVDIDGKKVDVDLTLPERGGLQK